MFTGIVEEIGRIQAAVELARARQLEIVAQKVLADTKIDDSICVNGVCLTVVAVNEETFTVQVVDETLRKTTLGNLRAGSRVNLERAVRLADRLGGHLVQGHIDGNGRIVAIEPQSAGKLMKVEVPAELLRYIIPRGSIALEGVSLTVARLEDPVITVALIPHTLECTTLGDRYVGAGLNIEADLIGKHLERLMRFSNESGLTEEKLAQWGY
ncbi:MAG: riboflavin synthase [bacterium]